MQRTYIGLDLAASPRRCTGFALIVEQGCATLREVRCLFTDNEILGLIRSLIPISSRVVVAIDAPLSFPKNGFIRDVDKKMISLGLRVLPPGLKGMKLLTGRAIKLCNELRSIGIEVIETHPRSVLKSSGCLDVESLLEKLNIERKTVAFQGHKDLTDAVLAAIAAFCLDHGCSYSVVGNEGTIYVLSKIC